MSVNPKLKKIHEKYPTAFWKDVILNIIENSKTGRVKYNIEAINHRISEMMQDSGGELFYKLKNSENNILVLLSDGYLQREDKLITITNEGIRHIENGGYMVQAEKSQKEQKRFDFEMYKIGYDSIISLVALLLSIASIIIALKK